MCFNWHHHKLHFRQRTSIIIYTGTDVGEGPSTPSQGTARGDCQALIPYIILSGFQTRAPGFSQVEVPGTPLLNHSGPGTEGEELNVHG